MIVSLQLICQFPRAIHEASKLAFDRTLPGGTHRTIPGIHMTASHFPAACRTFGQAGGRLNKEGPACTQRSYFREFEASTLLGCGAILFVVITSNLMSWRYQYEHTTFHLPVQHLIHTHTYTHTYTQEKERKKSRPFVNPLGRFLPRFLSTSVGLLCPRTRRVHPPSLRLRPSILVQLPFRLSSARSARRFACATCGGGVFSLRTRRSLGERFSGFPRGFLRVFGLSCGVVASYARVAVFVGVLPHVVAGESVVDEASAGLCVHLEGALLGRFSNSLEASEVFAVRV